MSPSILHVRWDMGLSDLSAVSPALTGTLNASGTVDGPTMAFTGDAQLTSTLSVRGSPSGTVTAAVKMRGLPSSPNGSIVAQGMLDGAPLQVDVALERSQAASTRAVVHRADWKSAHIDGDITVAPVASQSHGQFRLAVGQLKDLRDFLGADLGGSLAGNALLRSDRGRTHAQIHVDARDLAVGELAGNAQLTAEGATDALGFKLELQLPDLRGAKASLSAGGSFDLDARKVDVTSAVANYHGQDVRLMAPARIALANGVSVDVLKLGAQSAVLQVEGKISPALDLRASVQKLQPALINVFAPGILASGTVEAHAQLRGSVASPTGELRLTATDIRMADDAAFGLPSLDLQATAQLTGDAANIDARLVAGTASKLSLSGRAPLVADGALGLKINGTLDVGMINPILEARGQHAAGELEVDATVAGTAAAPQIGGTVNLTKGSVRDYVRGLSLTDITAAFVGSEGTLQIKSLTAAAAPGTLTVTGKVGVLQKGVPVDLSIKAVNAQPIASKLVTANLNADLHVSGTARARLDVAGSVHLNRTLIGIPNSLPSDVAVLDVRRRGKSAAAAVPEPLLVIGMDVAVQAPQEILVQGRGLDAEMGGELHVGGTLDSPVVTGFFDLQRGSFSLASNKLTFHRGPREFRGSGTQEQDRSDIGFYRGGARDGRHRKAARHRSCGCSAVRIHEQPVPAAGRNHGAAAVRRECRATHGVATRANRRGARILKRGRRRRRPQSARQAAEKPGTRSVDRRRRHHQ